MATASPRYGRLAFEHCALRLENMVLESARGFYIGTFNDSGPVSRESVEYWPTEEKAEQALASGEWTQRDHP